MQIIEKTHSAFESLAFVAKAASDDETRYFMNGVYIEGKEVSDHPGRLRLVATDGRRLHMVDLPESVDGLEPGNWKIESIAAKKIILGAAIDGQFPNYRKVVPDYPEGRGYKTLKGYGTFEKSSAKIGKGSVSMGALTREAFKVWDMTKRILNIAYLADLPSGEWGMVGQGDPEPEHNAIVFNRVDGKDGPAWKAVIMPMHDWE